MASRPYQRSGESFAPLLPSLSCLQMNCAEWHRLFPFPVLIPQTGVKSILQFHMRNVSQV